MPKIAVIFFAIALLAVSLVPISGEYVQGQMKKFESELKKIASKDGTGLKARLDMTAKESLNSIEQQTQDFEQTVQKSMQKK